MTSKTSNEINDMYIDKLAIDLNKKYQPVLPEAMKGALIGYGTGYALKPIADFILKLLKKKTSFSPKVIKLITDAMHELTNPLHHGVSHGLVKAIKSLRNNAELKNDEKMKIDMIYNQLNMMPKTASEVIDYMYKKAKMTVPTKAEAQKEKVNKDFKQPIECEVCDYIGNATDIGECPNCGAIGGVKKKSFEGKDEKYKDPSEQGKISVEEMDYIGRLEEQ